MINKILNRIKTSSKIKEYGTVNGIGYKIDNMLSIETWNGRCTGIYVDGVEVKIYSNSHSDEKHAREVIRQAIRDRLEQIKKDLINQL